jgi:catechol 2,3-dioxygenase-like lactoylglutathione lyase family enzyme
MKLDAVSVASTNLEKTARFYSLLGFMFPAVARETKHLESISPPGEVRLMIDDHAMVKSIMGRNPAAPAHSSFAIKCASPRQVDAAVAAIHKAGFVVVTEPWDAFWGQRYAIVADPDGYMSDLFAAL